MRKFLFNGAIISAAFSGISAFRATKAGPRDWRLALLWLAWAASTAIAVGNVKDAASHADD
ncbi:hypothetical protein GCM10025867_34880 [Frondihabitans sucicola]|uniref:Uncharacterized protein n=1 Tax=Frondihabitans sucicola TaxID=1268041 RepID=A0ABM8GS55_9MICO|nr:hypothetical protein [Frondihabitans sucicola]BDZ51247.1 hypothetical protein GCM10025867_34880 [Frondihabitans sucicola]